MAGKYLLDTNILIALFAKDAGVLNKLNQAAEVFIPAITLGELYYGARKSGRIAENTKRIEELADDNIILACDEETAKHYAFIKNNLRLKGRPIPENDIWIAAVAMQQNLILCTRDAHFQEIENLVIENW